MGEKVQNVDLVYCNRFFDDMLGFRVKFGKFKVSKNSAEILSSTEKEPCRGQK